MKYLKSLINYSGIALIYLQFSILFQLNIHFAISIAVFIFIAYSFVQIINGDRSGKKMRLPLVLCTAAIPLVILFRLQHWEGGALILLVSSTIFMSCYILRFIFKKEKGFMDVVKLFVIVSTISMLIMIFLRWPYAEQFGYVSISINVIGYILYLMTDELVVITHEREFPRTTLNIDEIKASEIIGCFECETIYNGANDIKFDGATAICPNCEKSTLIGSHNYNVTSGSLASLKREISKQKS